MKIKEIEKRELYLDVAREFKKWNMKVNVISIMVGALGLVKGLENLKIRAQVETIQTTALLR